jgi:hypothetical protein
MKKMWHRYATELVVSEASVGLLLLLPATVEKTPPLTKIHFLNELITLPHAPLFVNSRI